MRTYKGPGFVPGVPARDLTDAEWDEHVKAGRIDPKGPNGKLWQKAKDKGGN